MPRQTTTPDKPYAYGIYHVVRECQNRRVGITALASCILTALSPTEAVGILWRQHAVSYSEPAPGPHGHAYPQWSTRSVYKIHRVARGQDHPQYGRASFVSHEFRYGGVER